MLPNLNELQFLVPYDANFKSIQELKPQTPYNTLVLDFLDAWARNLLAHPESRAFPDIITFAFWIRKGNLQKYRNGYFQKHADVFRLGRGIVFHVASSNFPISFAYSLVVGLLAGNANIVKVSSRDFPQITLLATELEKLLAERAWQPIHDLITFVRYDLSCKEWTDFLSSFCDVRMIWGGDEPIQIIKSSQIPARAFDICFADRYSLCVINADKLVEEKDIDTLALGFYNDTYLFDQNAFTAPHLIVWLGSLENRRQAKKLFWESVTKIAESTYQLAPSTAVGKFITFCREAIRIEGAQRIPMTTNTVVRVRLEGLPQDITEYKSIGGYFNEFNALTLEEIAPIVTRKFQTLSYYGFEKIQLQKFIQEQRLVGIDRCVPIGKTLEFDPVWDGWDLIIALSRQIN